MTNRIDDALSFQSRALGLRAYRQQLLAGNIANADTPNYKARDIDFTKALQSALAGKEASSVALAKTDKAHASGKTGAAVLGGAPLLYRTTQQGNVDGNTVDMDVERNQFLDNALRYEAGVTLIGAQIKNLIAVVQG